MHSLLHGIPRFLILFLEELFLIFNQMLSIRTFGRGGYCVDGLELWAHSLEVIALFDITPVSSMLAF